MLKKSQKNGCGVGLCAWVIVILVMCCLTETQAGIFYDDFEDGNHNGWFLNEGGGGSNGVEYVNESNWAYVYSNRSGGRSLNQEFQYEADYLLSFYMHATATTGRWVNTGTGGSITYHAASGVTVTFENSFNMALGAVSFVYATSSSLLPANSHQIANTPNFFSGSMSEWAALANVSSSANISDVDLKFWTRGHGVSSGTDATARVRFDNVAVAVTVPEPTTLLLMALGGLSLLKRRK